jgi:hypothetical protein
MSRLLLALAVAAASSAAVVSITSAATDPRALPLGDGKVTDSAPRRGYVYLCSTRTPPNPPGAFKDGPWIKADGTFDLTAKAIVDGRVSWPGRVRFRRGRSKLKVTGNGLPRRHPTGTYPIAANDDAYQYDRNPNRISSQSVSLSLAAAPKRRRSAGCLRGGTIGIATNGVAIFNALDAGNRDAVAHETLDLCGGHPQQQGSYHYHAIPACLTRGQSTRGHSRLVGYVLDGFPIYGPRGNGGKLLENADLDRCHGHTHTVRFRGKRRRLFHYHATAEYPYTLGCYRGTPLRVARPR